MHLCISFSFLKKMSVCCINLLALRVALKDEGAKRRLSLLIAVTPVSVLNHESHEPPVLLVSCKLAHLSKLELRNEER